MTTNDTFLDWQRVRTDRELAGEWRLLRAKIRHVLDRSCVLASKLTRDIDDAYAIETLRILALDYLDGRPPRLPPMSAIDAVATLFDIDIDVERVFARAA